MKRFCLEILAASLVSSGVGFPCAAMIMPAPVEQATAAGSSRADVDLAAKIRRVVTRDRNLSLAAHNVDIIVKGGQVTIRGEVRSSAEREAILQIARDLAGPQNVADAIVIAPPKSK